MRRPRSSIAPRILLAAGARWGWRWCRSQYAALHMLRGKGVNRIEDAGGACTTKRPPRALVPQRRAPWGSQRGVVGLHAVEAVVAPGLSGGPTANWCIGPPRAGRSARAANERGMNVGIRSLRDRPGSAGTGSLLAYSPLPQGGGGWPVGRGSVASLASLPFPFVLLIL